MENWNFAILETFLLVHKKFKDAFENISEDTILALMDPHRQVLSKLQQAVGVPSNCIHCGLIPEDAEAKKEAKQTQYGHVCESITDRMHKYGITHQTTIQAAVYLMQQTNNSGYFKIKYMNQTLELPKSSDDNSLADELSSYDPGQKQQSVKELSIDPSILDGSLITLPSNSLSGQDDDNISQDILNDLASDSLLASDNLPSISRNDSESSLRRFVDFDMR